MTKRTRSRIQVAKMHFPPQVAGCTLRGTMRSSVTQEELVVEPLLLHIEKSQLRSVSDVPWMPPKGGVTGMHHWEEAPRPGQAGQGATRNNSH